MGKALFESVGLCIAKSYHKSINIKCWLYSTKETIIIWYSNRYWYKNVIIPNELVITWHHTGVDYMPVNNCTIATEGSKRIKVTWLGDKRQLTAVLVASSTTTNNICWENTTLSSNYEIPRRLRYHIYSKPLSKWEDNRNSYNESFGSLHWDMQEKSCLFPQIMQLLSYLTGSKVNVHLIYCHCLTVIWLLYHLNVQTAFSHFMLVSIRPWKKILGN